MYAYSRFLQSNIKPFIFFRNNGTLMVHLIRYQIHYTSKMKLGKLWVNQPTHLHSHKHEYYGR